MRKLFYILASIVLLSGCQNDGYIGDLFGKWQLRTVEKEGELGRCDTIFFSFQSEVFSTLFLVNPNSSAQEFGKFNHADNQLTIDLYKQGSSVDSPKFQIFGPSIEQEVGDTKVFRTTEVFDVIKLNKKEMILKSHYDDRILTFRKF